MYYSPVRHSSPKWSVRLACIRHAASVHPEPGSNSPLSYFFQTTLVCLALFYFFNLIDVVFYSFLFSFQCPLTWLSRRVPIYITIPSPFCKAFFLYFFIFFLYFANESHIFMQNSNRKESIGILSFCAEVSVFSYKNCIFATKLINKLTPWKTI